MKIVNHKTKDINYLDRTKFVINRRKLILGVNLKGALTFCDAKKMPSFVQTFVRFS